MQWNARDVDNFTVTVDTTLHSKVRFTVKVEWKVVPSAADVAIFINNNN